ncbi:hypothetical protein FKV24_004490 [Lysobacter maris]|uniref:Uncharacterized protein n=1 Tax=Marilutibacter maris TaxID=1605891 RepID=A0A508AYW1_9GAMM|nr:hypothetical protein [Lysobacter maris]KAB8196209.1 hypothetical protein FKV24_004490 [Lysobacter maris]
MVKKFEKKATLLGGAIPYHLTDKHAAKNRDKHRRKQAEQERATGYGTGLGYPVAGQKKSDHAE